MKIAFAFVARIYMFKVLRMGCHFGVRSGRMLRLNLMDGYLLWVLLLVNKYTELVSLKANFGFILPDKFGGAREFLPRRFTRYANGWLKWPC